MNKKFIIIILLILIVILAGVSLTKSKKGIPASDNEVNNQNLSDQIPLSENVSQSEGMVSPEVNVNYSNSGFDPVEITVKVGETVTWKNDSDKAMSVASDSHPVHEKYPGFDQLNSVNRGGEYSFIFNRIGVWGYHNHLSPADSGQVTVVE